MQRLRDNSSEDSVAPVRDIELTQLISSLDPDRRDAFVLTQILGLSYDEAAEICGCPVGTIRSRVARARTDAVYLMNQASDAAEA
jgi:RNA polymerase sigma-70 factor (ECF subfamily)